MAFDPWPLLVKNCLPLQYIRRVIFLNHLSPSCLIILNGSHQPHVIPNDKHDAIAVPCTKNTTKQPPCPAHHLRLGAHAALAAQPYKQRIFQKYAPDQNVPQTRASLRDTGSCLFFDRLWPQILRVWQHGPNPSKQANRTTPKRDCPSTPKAAANLPQTPFLSLGLLAV